MPRKAVGPCPCENGLASWPCNPKLDEMRRAWWEKPDPAKRRASLDEVSACANEVLSSDTVTGIQATTVPVFRGVEKKQPAPPLLSLGA